MFSCAKFVGHEANIPGSLEPWIFFGITTSIADAASVNPNGIQTLLASSLITFFINDKPTFIKGPRTLPKDPPKCIILEIYVCNNFVLEGKLFTSSLESIVTRLSVKESPILFDDKSKFTSVKIFVANFNLLSC